MTDEIKKIPYRLTVKSAMGDVEVFMSAGLIRHLASIVAYQDNLALVYTDPTLQTVLMSETLVPRNQRGEGEEELNVMDKFNLDPDEANNLVEWIAGHVMNFFIEGAERVRKSLEEGNPLNRLSKLTPSLSGSVASQ